MKLEQVEYFSPKCNIIFKANVMYEAHSRDSLATIASARRPRTGITNYYSGRNTRSRK